MIQQSRRGFITGLVAFVAAPAIVRAANIMPVKALPLASHDGVILRQMTEYIHSEVTQLDVLYGKLSIDEYSDRLLKPMVNSLAQAVANHIMDQSSDLFPNLISISGKGVLYV